MLNIQKLDHLSNRLGCSTRELDDLLNIVKNDPSRYYQKYLLTPPGKPSRPVLGSSGFLRHIQNNLHVKVLRPTLKPSPHSYGGVKGQSILSNADLHKKSTYACTLDISKFYPSISHRRVFDYFLRNLNCSPDVASVCTKLCTFDHHLALGLVTSPIIADQIMSKIDLRIANACALNGIIYSRFVDDITLSGNFNIGKSGIITTIENIIMHNGFKLNLDKKQNGKISSVLITKLRISRGNIDVSKHYIERLNLILDDSIRVQNKQNPLNEYHPYPHIKGMVNYVCWIRPHHFKTLMPKFQSVNWKQVNSNALSMGLVSLEKKIVKIPFSTN